ncbi:MAG: HEPN domain-containing protein [Bacteroidaceae bacterium]|nr:HEPN domain-containing protein [Bacteroidaceae bacterium]
MSLDLEDRKTLVNLEFEKASNIISQIQLFHQNKFWDTIANRLYYAVYHAVVALFIHDGIEVGTHKTTINRFGNYYVQTGIFTPQDGKLFSRLKSIREASDYTTTYAISQETLEPRIVEAQDLVVRIRQYLKETPYKDSYEMILKEDDEIPYIPGKG